MGELPETVFIMREQAVRLMALAILVRDGDLEIRRNAFRRDTDAEALLAEVSQECALQLGGMP